MKRMIALLLAVMLVSVMLTGCITIKFNDDQPVNDSKPAEATQSAGTDAPEATAAAPAPEPEIRPAEWNDVQWTTYTSKYFTLSIPAGWTVEWKGDANQLMWMATSPDMTVGFFNRDHAYAAKDANMQQALGFDMSLSSGTVQEYFETLYAGSTEYYNVQNSCVPANKDVLQSIRPNTPIRDYQALYATFKDENVEGEGIYTAVIMDSKDVVFNGYNYGAWEINCIFTEWAPFGRLVDWSPVLATIGQSFNYTQQYITEWQQIAQTTLTPSSPVNDNDPVMEAFEERSRSDTIIQEKRSDMIGEYERVYDNDTGEIYRAYNGFLDDMGDQSRYTPITDSQYADGYVGWIDKD